MLKTTEKTTKLFYKGNIEMYYLTHYFLEEIKATYKKLTYQERVSVSNKYIMPFFNNGQLVTDTVTISNVMSFKQYVYNLNLSISRKNLIFSVLRQILIFAEDREYLESNYAEKIIRMLKSIRKEKVLSKKIVFWTPEEFNLFINTFETKDRKWRYYFLLTYWGALRMGEVNALTWEDLNFQMNYVDINKSMDREGEINSPKNESSNDSVDLPTFLLVEFKQWKEEVKPDNETDLLFFNNHRLGRTNIRTVMRRHINMCGVTPIKFHGLRHSMASRMINQGCNPLLVSKHLRHSSTQQTLDTYSHLFPNVTKGLMDRLV
ncbi:MAG: site-specific integrase [Bacilli bacterium]|jgi:integrase